MKRIVFQCVSNVLLFILFGLTFLFPLLNVNQTEDGFSGNLTIFPLLFIVYIVIYPIVNFILRKKYGWGKKNNSELTYSDEREKMIVSEAVKIAYMVLVGGLIVIIGIIGGLRFFSLFSHIEISMYFTSVTLLTTLLVITSISYCLKWCKEYRR